MSGEGVRGGGDGDRSILEIDLEEGGAGMGCDRLGRERCRGTERGAGPSNGSSIMEE